ncbi:helix-turn-helix protein [Clostridium sp. CAG:413]|jgi:transcriptional regulator with XRE-family HTH domain|nr:helix-turn-helix protein [Clostridium sp. CAG:413]
MRNYLKSIRNEKKMTQQDVADKLNISHSYYSMIEKGERKQEMSISMLCKLSEVFDVSVSELIEAERNFSAAG